MHCARMVNACGVQCTVWVDVHCTGWVRWVVHSQRMLMHARRGGLGCPCESTHAVHGVLIALSRNNTYKVLKELPYNMVTWQTVMLPPLCPWPTCIGEGQRGSACTLGLHMARGRAWGCCSPCGVGVRAGGGLARGGGCSGTPESPSSHAGGGWQGYCSPGEGNKPQEVGQSKG